MGKQIDLEKLRAIGEQHKRHHLQVSINADEFMDLLDHISQLEKDAAIGKLAKKAFQELQDSPISFMKTIGRAIDAAMEASNAKAD